MKKRLLSAALFYGFITTTAGILPAHAQNSDLVPDSIDFSRIVVQSAPDWSFESLLVADTYVDRSIQKLEELQFTNSDAPGVVIALMKLKFAKLRIQLELPRAITKEKINWEKLWDEAKNLVIKNGLEDPSRSLPPREVLEPSSTR